MSGSESSLVAGKHTRRRSLDGIRAIAILGVFGYHATIPWATGGWLGVEAFFVLSGYLITTLLLNEHRKTGAISLRRFWGRRMLRLWPALLVMVIVVAPGHALGTFPINAGAYVRSAVQIVLYIADLKLAYFGGGQWGAIGHTWTLGVEMYFYLLWPALLVFLLKRSPRLIVPTLLALIAASIAATLIFFAADPSWLIFYYAPHTQVLPILLGCLLAALRHDRLLPQMPRGSGSVLAAVGLAGLVALLIFSTGEASDTPRGFYVPLLEASLATWTLLLGLELSPNSLVAALLSWEPLAALGLVSYGFYLYQSPMVFELGPSLGLSLYPHAICILLMSIGCAALSWFVVEQQFLRIKDRLGARVDAITVDTADPTMPLRPRAPVRARS